MIIAIDGYSSSGKSTLAKDLAKHLGIIYVDTGAMYRAVTLYFISRNIDFNINEEVIKHLEKMEITFVPKHGENRIFLNGQDVSAEIRTLTVSNKVSEIAALPEVRKKLVAIQQNMATNSLVMDGRDIGTVVFPNANYKFFVTANIEERSRRRHLELTSKGDKVSFQDVEENLKHRDQIDTTRKTSPLRQAEDAILIDTTELTRSQQLKFVLNIVENN